MFCFSRANHASTNLKKFSSSKLDKFTLFSHSFVGWNLENRYKEGWSIFFNISFKHKNENLWQYHYSQLNSTWLYHTICHTRINWIPKIITPFYLYWRLRLGIETVSCSLLQLMVRIKMLPKVNQLQLVVKLSISRALKNDRFFNVSQIFFVHFFSTIWGSAKNKIP